MPYPERAFRTVQYSGTQVSGTKMDYGCSCPQCKNGRRTTASVTDDRQKRIERMQRMLQVVEWAADPSQHPRNRCPVLVRAHQTVKR